MLTVSLLLAVAGLTLGMEYYGIGKDDNEIAFNIPEGSTNEQIADLLVENGIIKNKKLFIYTLKIMKPATIYPGDIKLQPSQPYSDIIEELEKQRETYETVTVTFTEGEYLVDIAKKLEDNNVCKAEDFLFEFNRDMGYKFEGYLTENKNVFYSREGYLFPDTYEFYVNDTAYNICRILRDHYDSKINEAMYKKMNDRGLTLNETITLASIVQLEAANVDEMPRVASVFLNRMKDSDTFPMLQSDTTYNYINKVIKPNTKNDDLVLHYAEYYDTYAIDGLPAGPICNPGMDAINAVLNPEKTDYYYFCNDIETGETFYAETLDEHEKNLVKAGRGDQVVEDTADNGNEDNNE
ncbi:endolytic transglycosylase MltG [Ruminococcus albus]|uniref:endolytic transglycosylase MltG n=1 Tax=Ruminococcus albus TaxID=1264 RepID=UPI003D6D85C3